MRIARSTSPGCQWRNFSSKGFISVSPDITGVPRIHEGCHLHEQMKFACNMKQTFLLCLSMVCQSNIQKRKFSSFARESLWVKHIMWKLGICFIQCLGTEFQSMFKNIFIAEKIPCQLQRKRNQSSGLTSLGPKFGVWFASCLQHSWLQNIQLRCSFIHSVKILHSNMQLFALRFQTCPRQFRT